MHLTEHVLRAYLDRELGEVEYATTAGHLLACEGCRARLNGLEGRAARVGAHLAALAPLPAESPRPEHMVWAQLKSRGQKGKDETSMFKNLFARRLRPVWAGLAIVAALTAAFSFAPVRAWAGQFLGLFRIQQVMVLPIDTTRLSALSGDEALGSRISQLFSDSVKVTKEPTDARAAASAAEASQAAGFAVRLPGNRSDAPQLTVQDGTAFEFVINRDRAQAVLNEMGYSHLQLPASLDGAAIQVEIPTGVTAAYGNCPRSDEEAGSPGRRFANCVLFVQIPSPTVNTPPDLDVEQLAEIGLQLTGMTAEQAREYSQTVDWASTLVVPIPRNGATYRQIEVDGVTGYLIQRPSDDAPQYALVWVKNGILYTIGGLGADSASALEMANSLP